MSESPPMHGTTILSVRHGGKVAIGGDGQITVGPTVMKADAKKVRALRDGRVLVGFAGAAADALALLERFDAKLGDSQGQVLRAAVELAKDWRTDRVLRRLEAMLAVVDAELSLVLSGSGEIIEPEDGIIGIGSGGAFASCAAKALTRHAPEMSPKQIVEEAMAIAAETCIYTNERLVVMELDGATPPPAERAGGGAG